MKGKSFCEQNARERARVLLDHGWNRPTCLLKE
jgi:hypothetical protein